jgi:hypothetical protein
MIALLLFVLWECPGALELVVEVGSVVGGRRRGESVSQTPMKVLDFDKSFIKFQNVHLSQALA